MRFLRVFAVVCALFPGHAVFAQQPPPKPQPQDEYVPLDQLPPQAELPAAPMVIAAYSFVWVAFLVYMLSLVRRITRVEADLRELEQRSKQ